MLNFTVGPVQMSREIRAIGGGQIPYFRTPEFSASMKQSERLFLELLDAPVGSRGVFLTGSGTAGMEAAVANTLTRDDRAIIVDGGSFGHRFVEICEIYEIPCDVVCLDPGSALKEADLTPYENDGHTAFVVNLGETSTGVLYDLALISDFCARNNLFLIVDAVSAFLADPLSMASHGCDVVITGSQKALATPPGVSLLALSPRAQRRVQRGDPRSLYFDLKRSLVDGERGQTPFTPAVGTLLQINARLRQLARKGVDSEVERVSALACDFRSQISELPFELFAETPSNAVTSLCTGTISAQMVFNVLKDEYGIWVCPNGGELARTVFRVGHIGDLSFSDNKVLVGALFDMADRGLLEGR